MWRLKMVTVLGGFLCLSAACLGKSKLEEHFEQSLCAELAALPALPDMAAKDFIAFTLEPKRKSSSVARAMYSLAERPIVVNRNAQTPPHALTRQELDNLLQEVEALPATDEWVLAGIAYSLGKIRIGEKPLPGAVARLRELTKLSLSSNPTYEAVAYALYLYFRERQTNWLPAWLSLIEILIDRPEDLTPVSLQFLSWSAAHIFLNYLPNTVPRERIERIALALKKYSHEMAYNNKGDERNRASNANRLMRDLDLSFSAEDGATSAAHRLNAHFRLQRQEGLPFAPLKVEDQTPLVRQIRPFLADDLFELNLTSTSRRALGFKEHTSYEFKVGLLEFQKFLRTNKHPYVRPLHITQSKFKLGAWVRIIRERYREGSLNEDEIRELDAVNFPYKIYEARFQEFLDYLEAYRAKKGHIDVPQDDVIPKTKNKRAYPLGTRLATMRARYKRGELSPEKIRVLNKMGISWTPRDEISDARFDFKFNALKEYARKYNNNNCNVGRTAYYKGVPLGDWVGSLRVAYWKDELSPERIARLERIGFSWRPSSDKFERGMKYLQIFYEKNGHARVPEDEVTKDGFPLGTWLAAKKQSQQWGILPKDQEARLNEFGVRWRPPRPQPKRVRDRAKEKQKREEAKKKSKKLG